MKDAKSGRMKKYIHEIRINFDLPEYKQDFDVNRMCDDICRKETIYLNPAYISRNQVSAANELIRLWVRPASTLFMRGRQIAYQFFLKLKF